MPIEDGYAMMRGIRALAPELGGDVPSIALSAMADPDADGRATAAGYELVLGKPFDPARLVRAVAAVAARRESEAAAGF